jgi:hypothetical protein
MFLEKIELFALGFLASLSTKFFEKGDLALIKVFFYMRAIEGFFLLIITFLEKKLKQINNN